MSSHPHFYTGPYLVVNAVIVNADGSEEPMSPMEASDTLGIEEDVFFSSEDIGNNIWIHNDITSSITDEDESSITDLTATDFDEWMEEFLAHEDVREVLGTLAANDIEFDVRIGAIVYWS